MNCFDDVVVVVLILRSDYSTWIFKLELCDFGSLDTCRVGRKVQITVCDVNLVANNYGYLNRGYVLGIFSQKAGKIDIVTKTKE